MQFIQITNEIYSGGKVPVPRNDDMFIAEGNTVPGVNLQDVLDDSVNIYGADQLFADTRDKVSMRILVDGHQEYRRAPNISCLRAQVKFPISRREIMQKAGRVVKGFIDRESKLARQPGLWQFGPDLIEPRHIYMTKLLHVSEGSYQPILFAWVPVGTPTTETPQMVLAPEPPLQDTPMAHELVPSTEDTMPADLPAMQAPASASWGTTATIQYPVPNPQHAMLPVIPGTQAPPSTPVAGIPPYSLELAKIDVLLQEFEYAAYFVASNPNTPGYDWSPWVSFFSEIDRMPIDTAMGDVSLVVSSEFQSTHSPQAPPPPLPSPSVYGPSTYALVYDPLMYAFPTH